MTTMVLAALAGAGVAGMGAYLACAARLGGLRAELRAREEALGQLREDGEADLRRQAGQYEAQIAGLNGRLEDLQRRFEDARDEATWLQTEKAGGEAELRAEREKVAELRRQYDVTLQKAEDRFKALAQSILDDRSAKLQREGEKGMQDIARTLKADLDAFRKRVDAINSETAERTGKLDERIKGLVQQTNAVSEQANNLADAIRGDAQMTGVWGEMQLKRVLELGGLQETVDYTYQETFASAESDHKDLRTDVLVKMTDGRWMVVDAKTTLAAYMDLVASGPEGADPRPRIVESLKAHVEEMKTAAYHRKLQDVTGKKILNTMLMYIPLDEVYLIAMKAEVKVGGARRLLRDYALENGVVFINATGLLPVVRMLAEFWSAEKSHRKTQEIRKAAEALVEKVRLFLEGSRGDGFLDLGTQLAAAVRSYNESVKRLSSGPGNILKKVADLKDMGIATDALPASEKIEAKQIPALPSPTEMV